MNQVQEARTLAERCAAALERLRCAVQASDSRLIIGKDGKSAVITLAKLFSRFCLINALPQGRTRTRPPTPSPTGSSHCPRRCAGA
jgi:hypothetical protein